MYISKDDLDFLVELEYKLYETSGFTEYVERLWKLNEKLINNRKSSNERTLKYITEKRKTNPIYGRSKREIENRQKAEQKRLNKKKELKKMIKPVCKLTGENGNIFNLLKIASRILYRNNMRDKAVEMQHRVFCSNSYEDALSIISEYVEIE